jgi:integrase
MSPMAKVELRYVQRFKDRHGQLRHYFRRPGFPRTRLPDLPGSDAFMAAYADCLGADKQTAGEARTAPYSISALIVAYYATADYRRLEKSTKTTYRNMLDRFRDKWGHLSGAKVETRHLDAIFEQMAATPGAARNLRKRLRRVFRVAVKKGWRSDNPVTETDRPEIHSDGFVPWSEDDIAKYEAYWPSGTRQRRALALLLYTGQRRSDVVGMGRQHQKGHLIRVRQIKTRKTNPDIYIPVHPALQIELDHVPPGDLTFLLTQYGKPFSAAGFTAWFRESAEAAGLKGRTPHGLRKAAGRRLAEAGCSEKEIAAVLGHRSLSEVQRYTRDADQIVLAERAMTKLQTV